MSEYYIQNRNCCYFGNSPMWWAKGGNGYTAYVQNAERFSEEDALDLVKESSSKWSMFKCEEVDRRLHLVYDSQDNKRLGENPVGKPHPWGSEGVYASEIISQLQAKADMCDRLAESLANIRSVTIPDAERWGYFETIDKLVGEANKALQAYNEMKEKNDEKS